MGLDLVGFLARPVYVCTAKVGVHNQMCCSVASMSRLIRHSRGRLFYRCKRCLDSEIGGVVSDEIPKRILLLYALVSIGSSDPTPVHMKPVRLVVSAPPQQWAWNALLGAVEFPRMPSEPKRGQDCRGCHWSYETRASDAFWLHSGPYQGEALRE